MKRQIAFSVADIYGAPDANAFRGKFETQMVFGEVFIVEEEKGGWCKGASAHDGYAGYIQSSHLTQSFSPPTHVVTAARSHIYRNETIKSPTIDTLSFGSLINITSVSQGFAQINHAEWIYQKHIAPVSLFEKDHVATARKFLETPYYWGGRSGFGIDCSGLVQVSLARAGIAVPRDTDQQENAFGKAVDTPGRGDIVYFPGHVGIMTDDQNLLHANAFHMKVTIEPLSTVIKRGEKEISAIRRL